MRLLLDSVGRLLVVLAGSLAIGLGLLWVPTGLHFGLSSTPSAATSFLSTLWQVGGGTVALTLTLVAFEAIWRSPLSPKIRCAGRTPVRVAVLGALVLGPADERPACGAVDAAPPRRRDG
jgi:hypothetical protein